MHAGQPFKGSPRQCGHVTHKKANTVKLFLFIGHLISCISGVGQSTHLRS